MMELHIRELRKFDEPLYKWVKRGLIELIGLGTWRPAQAIPSERKLSEGFGVSMGTIRRALDELVDDDVLVRHQGRGTFVTAHDRNRYLFSFFNVCGHDGQRIYPVVILIDFDSLRADAFAARSLSISPGAKVVRIRNLLTLKGVPTLVDEILLPAARFAGISRERVAHRSGTLYQLYEEQFRQSVTRIEERVRATVANAQQAADLGVDPGYPLLHIVRRAFAVDGTPIELRHSFVKTEHYEYSRTLHEADRGRGRD